MEIDLGVAEVFKRRFFEPQLGVGDGKRSVLNGFQNFMQIFAPPRTSKSSSTAG